MAHGALADAVSSSQRRDRITVAEASTDGRDGPFVELCVAVRGALENALGMLSHAIRVASTLVAAVAPSLDSVAYVVELRSQLQMFWIAAPRIVALVQDAEPVRDRTGEQDPRKTRSEPDAGERTRDSAARGVAVLQPRPARVGSSS